MSHRRRRSKNDGKHDDHDDEDNDHDPYCHRQLPVLPSDEGAQFKIINVA